MGKSDRETPKHISVARVVFSREMLLIAGMTLVMGALGNVEFQDEKLQDQAVKAKKELTVPQKPDSLNQVKKSAQLILQP